MLSLIFYDAFDKRSVLALMVSTDLPKEVVPKRMSLDASSKMFAFFYTTPAEVSKILIFVLTASPMSPTFSYTA